MIRAASRLPLPIAWLLLAACSGEPGAAPVQGESDWRKSQVQQQEREAEAAREEQAREDAQAAELRQAVQAVESDPSATLSEGQFFQELQYYCGACHFPEPTISSGGEQPYWLFFDDLQHMIARSRVIPGDAEGSPIVVRMRRDQTPPEGWNTPPVTDSAIQLVADFINRLPPEPDENAGG